MSDEVTPGSSPANVTSATSSGTSRLSSGDEPDITIGLHLLDNLQKAGPRGIGMLLPGSPNDVDLTIESRTIIRIRSRARDRAPGPVEMDEDA
jgi:hypothetical protein